MNSSRLLMVTHISIHLT